MARLRTIPAALTWLHKQDPDTAITENWLRYQIKKGLIPFHRAGKRCLLDLDYLEEYLSNPPSIYSDAKAISKIRRISEK